VKYVDPRLPKYQDGMRVRALIDLHNDGSHPNFPPDSLLVATGMQGEIINVGEHAETNTPVYLVEFSETLVIGVLEEEIEPVEMSFPGIAV
jgi:nitrogen fixation protein NifZ